jgi:hypothetical protein
MFDDGLGMAEDRDNVEDRTPSECGNLELEQATTVAAASIRQPIVNLFEIFTTSIAPFPFQAS